MWKRPLTHQQLSTSAVKSSEGHMTFSPLTSCSPKQDLKQQKDTFVGAAQQRSQLVPGWRPAVDKDEDDAEEYSSCISQTQTLNPDHQSQPSHWSLKLCGPAKTC